MEVTAQQVRDAAIAAGITSVAHHRCGCCGSMVYYSIENGLLWFHPACDCTSYYSPPEPCAWHEAASWINVNTGEHKVEIAKKFGLLINPDGSPIMTDAVATTG